VARNAPSQRHCIDRSFLESRLITTKAGISHLADAAVPSVELRIISDTELMTTLREDRGY
jgi:hypothetical protein